MNYQLLQGDNRTVLRSLPDQSVHCIVTSPPYYGLRDYGTAQWDGGDPACDHKIDVMQRSERPRNGLTGGLEYMIAKNPVYKETCGKCGATRIDQQIGLEATPEQFVAELVSVFRECWRVLRDDGVLWVNLGDSYATRQKGGNKSKEGDKSFTNKGSVGIPPVKQNHGMKDKDLIGIPWMVAFALRSDGWYLRSDIIWHKPNPMPEGVTDRPTKAHEYIFLLTKSQRYYYDADAVREDQSPGTIERFGNGKAPRKAIGPKGLAFGVNGGQSSGSEGVLQAGRNRRSVWTVATQPFNGWTETSHLERVVTGALSGGMTHRVFADCPLHGSRCRQDSTLVHDEHGADGLNHTGRTYAHHDQSRVDGSVPIDQIRAPMIQEQNSDYSPQQYLISAIDHNKQTSKTDHVRQTSLHDTAYARTLFHTENMEPLHAASVQHHGNGGNNTSVDGSDDNPSNQNHVHTIDKPVSPELYGASVDSFKNNGCICEFYHKVTKKSSHFATFPPALIEPCILAGTSEYGCCAQCGAPWERVVERTDQPDLSAKGSYFDKGKTGVNGGGRVQHGERYVKQVTGWQATCACAADVIPCTVCDPFNGSGTTGAVAVAHGRDYIGIDLSADYIALAHERIREAINESGRAYIAPVCKTTDFVDLPLFGG